MSTTHIAAIIFLTVACIGALIQGSSLYRLIKIPSSKIASNLYRTIVWRSLVAVLYLIIGVNATFYSWNTTAASLVGFAATQLIWSMNSIFDVRLKRKMNGESHDYL